MTATWSFLDLRGYVWAGFAGLGLGLLCLVSPLLALAAVAGIVFCSLAFQNPMVLCYTFILATVMTSGIPRGNLIPLLIPHEAFLLLALALSFPVLLFRKRRVVFPPAITAAIVILFLGTVILPLLSYLARRVPLSISDMFSLLAPLKFLLIFYLFTTVPETDEERQKLIYCLLIGCFIVAVVGLLQAFRVRIIVDVLLRYYPSSHLAEAESSGRVTSLLRAWNALGTFMMANLILILSLQVPRHERLQRLLVIITAVLAGGCLLASGAYAPLLGLVMGVLIVKLIDRRGLRTILLLVVALAIFVIILEPLISRRFQYQFGANNTVPSTLAYRFQVWAQVFGPILKDNWLLGVSPTLTGLSWQWAESQYIYLLYRSGVLSLIAHLAWMGITAAWLYRKIRTSTGLTRTLAIVGFALIAVLTAIGLTNEVFTLSGVVEYLWILLALVVGSASTTSSEQRPVIPAWVVGNRLAVIPQPPRARDLPVTGAAIAPTRKVEKKRRFLEGSILNSSAAMAVGIAIARVLGFAFSFVLVRAFEPADFGSVQYTITLAGVIAIGTQPFTQHILARAIGRYKADELQLQKVLGNLWTATFILFIITLVVTVPLLAALEHLSLGVFIVYIGITIFYTYYGLARGFLSNIRLLVAYVGSNLVQIIATLFVIYVLKSRSTLVVLSIYGLSYLPPLFLLQTLAPLPLHFKLALPAREVLVSLFRSSVAIWISHICYILYASIDVLLVEQYLGHAAVGAYALTKTLGTAFSFIPMAITATLMPQVAGSPPHEHGRLLKKALLWSSLTNAAGLLVYVIAYRWFIEKIFGQAYVVSPTVFIAIAVAFICQGIHSIISAVLVGSNRANFEAISMVAGVIAALLGGWLLVPTYGLEGAAFSLLAGSLTVLLVYGGIAVRQKAQERNQRQLNLAPRTDQNIPA